ncbi:DUF6281 family protein [Streptomyces sp. DSM 40750]|uniref:DUF6281 family protein n=1 Tax=Streptomyces sp. DSM 40750 TaxID=2801030 RepID=UPI00214C4992|nr:DUF6281 family protein [Streptomyces sp. DSM 40750]UUU23807.1 DUF6281 family protein [Streptomyces sp. DSM 40750]
MIGSRVRAALAALVTTPLAVGCTAMSGGGESAASCAFVVEYEGHEYMGMDSGEFEVGAKVGTALAPPCNDTGGDGWDESRTEEPTRYDVYEIEGVDVEDAFSVHPDFEESPFMLVRDGRDLPPEVMEIAGRRATPPEDSR